MPSGTQSTGQVTVTGSKTPILPPNGTRQTATIRVVTASSTVYIGGANVSTSNGYPIKDTDAPPYSTTSTDGIWGITGGGSITVAFDEVNQD